MKIINGDDPTDFEKDILVEQRNMMMKTKMEKKIRENTIIRMYEETKADLEKAKKDTNKRRNMRKKLRRKN
jgi:hypothetical protein